MATTTLAPTRPTHLATLAWIVLCGVTAALLLYVDVIAVIPHAKVGADFGGYLTGAQRFLDTGSPYAPVQLAGPYEPWNLPNAGVFLYPPTALALFVPFLVLPAALWWVVPLAAVAWSVYRWQPSPVAWAAILVCAAWPRSVGAVLLGNADVWVMAGVALGLRFGWPFVILLMKPTLAPLALLGIRHRSLWIAGAALAVGSLAFLPLWAEWVTALRNGQGLDLAYSLGNLPLVALPLVAWVARRRRGEPLAERLTVQTTPVPHSDRAGESNPHLSA